MSTNIEYEKDDGMTAICLDEDMKGCLSQGDNEEHAIEMITEAIQLYNECKGETEK